MAPAGSYLKRELGKDEAVGKWWGPFRDQGTSSLEQSRTSHGNCVQGCYTAIVLPATEGGLRVRASLPASWQQTRPSYEHPSRPKAVCLPGNRPVFFSDTSNVIFGKLEDWDKHSFSLKQQLGNFCCYFFFLFVFPKVHFAQKLVLFIRRKKNSLGKFFFLGILSKGQITLEIAERGLLFFFFFH